MTKYINRNNLYLAEAEARGPALPGAVRTVRAVTSLATRALDALVTWQNRERERRHLMGLDNRMLRDMGISRADVEREYRKKFWQP